MFVPNLVVALVDIIRRGVQKAWGTNAVYHEELLKREWYISTDVSGLFANVITRIHYNQSLSELLDNRNIIEKVVKHE